MTIRDPLVLLEERAEAAPPVHLELATRLRVPFSGSRGGDGPITVGQSTTLIWIGDPTLYTRMMEWPFAIRPGTTLAAIAGAMEFLIVRHEALRTTFPPADPPVQRVARSGELIIDVYETSSAEQEQEPDPSVLTMTLIRLLRSAEFDHAADLPVRMAIAAWHGEPRAAVAVYSHMAVDFASMALMDQQFTALLRDPGSLDDLPPAHQPLDQAADERSSRGTRRNEGALRSWDQHLRAMPQCLYAVPLDKPGPAGGESGWLWSRAAALALPHIAARTGTSRQLVVLAAYCAMICWRTGHAHCVLPVSSSNRYQRHLRGYVGPLAQDSIMHIDTRTDSLDALVRRTAAAALRGNHNSLIDIETLDPVIDAMEEDRGIAYARHLVFTDLSLHFGDTETVDPGADPAAPAHALDQTRYATLAAHGCEEILLVLLQQVNDEVIIGGLTRDASLMPAGEVEMLLRGVEALLIAAASGDVTLDRLAEVTGVRQIARGPAWLMVDNSWVDLAQVRRLVADALPGPAAAFGSAEHGLVGYLSKGHGIDSPEQAHSACVSLLRESQQSGEGRHTAMTPRWYVVCAGAPAETSDLTGWQQQAVVGQGDGRPAR